jgi:2-dehydro-3-deoxygluconokinase
MPGEVVIADVVTFGEAMLRLSPPSRERLESTTMLDMHVGGAESNVAVALARLGTPTAWVSCLPDTPLGRRVAAAIAGAGVDISHVRFVPDGRVGLYFVEFGSPPRPTSVWYDRADSAFSLAVDWEASALEGARFAVVSGITPALSQRARSSVIEFVSQARSRGVSVVVDVNYRSRLWTPVQALPVVSELISRADIVVCSAADARTVFGGEGPDKDVAVSFAEQYASAARLVCMTCSDRGSLAVERGGSVIRQTAIPTDVVDRFGAGDAFLAGVIYTLLSDGSARDALAFASALAALKCTVHGDHSTFTRADVDAVLAGEMLRR